MAMPLDELHQQVAAIALQAPSEHGFALGGGNALIAHGLISRPTQDVDLFTNQERGVEAAAGSVEAALREAGLQAERQDEAAGLADIFYGMGRGLAEWEITGPGGEQMAPQMAYFERSRGPVIMEFGPVLDLEDAIGGKVCALASRAYERDYLDTAAALEHYTPQQLISFAERLDPGLEAEDFADAARRLDSTPDEAFTRLGMSEADVGALRERFAAWPREAEPRRELSAELAGPTAGRDPASAREPAAEAGPTSSAAAPADAGSQETGTEPRARATQEPGSGMTAAAGHRREPSANTGYQELGGREPAAEAEAADMPPAAGQDEAEPEAGI